MSGVYSLSLKTDYLNTCVTSENVMKSARPHQSGSVKDKFAVFMRRKENREKRNSDLSGSSISDEKILDEEYLRTSRASARVGKPNQNRNSNFSNFGKFNNRHSLNKENEPKFSLFEVKDKTKIKKYNKHFSRYKDRDSIHENSYIEYFSINQIESAKKSTREKHFNFNFDLDLPKPIQEEIQSNLDECLIENQELYDNVEISLNKVKEYKMKLIEENKKDKEIKSELKEIKNARNKLIAEKVVLSNELDFIKSSNHFIHSKLSTDKLDTKAFQDLQNDRNDRERKGNLTSQMKSLTESVPTEYDSVIDELENKLSYLKLENSKFFENIDYLNDEYVENEEKNKVSVLFFNFYF